MIETLKRVQRDLTLACSGVQETVISIADHVNQHIQKMKLTLDRSVLEKEIQQKQTQLGQKIYEQSDLPLSQLYAKPDVQVLLDKILTAQKQLEAIEGIVSPYEALHEFERLLIRSDFVVQNVVILEGYSGIGKSIQKLAPPPQMHIFFIKRQNRVELAYGNLFVHLHDEVTFLCSKENIQHYIAFWK